MRIYHSNNYDELKDVEKSTKKYMGYFYILEYGNKLKIGSSKNPYQRLLQLKKQAEYNNIEVYSMVLSEPHTNYMENEHYIHNLLKESRIKGTELFNLKVNEAIEIIETSMIEYKDETEKFMNNSKALSEALKNFVLCGHSNIEEKFTYDNETFHKWFEKALKNPSVILEIIEEDNRERKFKMNPNDGTIEWID